MQQIILRWMCCAAVFHGMVAQCVSEEMDRESAEQIQQLTLKIADSPQNVSLYSARGDAYFFANQIPAAIKDYEQMVQLQPGLEASHWRRGIAYFYAERYADAVAQFEKYHSYDNVDRENGIWRYLSIYQAQGRERARDDLLRYEKDDREPFQDVYKLFAGQITPEQILLNIDGKQLSSGEREKQLFYATLYIGLNHLVEGDEAAARKNLQLTVDNKWGPQAGYGPHYMWQVARLQLTRLKESSKQ